MADKTGPCEFPWKFGKPCGEPGRWYEGEGPCGSAACGRADGRLVVTSPPSFAVYTCVDHAWLGVNPGLRLGAFLCPQHSPR